MATLADCEEVIRKLVRDLRYTYSDVAEYLQVNEGVVTSGRSVRRFCTENNIRFQKVDDVQLAAFVNDAVKSVGPTFGRKMITGYLRSVGVCTSEVRVGKILKAANEPYHTARSQGIKNFNPVPYYAEYFGHKLHFDQNEKLVMFGVTHVVGIDGFSKKIVAWSTMPIKNNLLIYDNVYRSAVTTFGMWDQVRVDHGKEFYLLLFMQQLNESKRRNRSRQPFIQTTSKRNHTVERVWPEINNRLNYPLKNALVQLLDNDMLDMDDNITRYCVSSLCIELCNIGMNRIISAWNEHRIPGRGIPNILALSNNASAPVNAHDLPEAVAAADLYARETGGMLTVNSEFATDPFHNDAAKQQCINDFMQSIANLEDLLNSVVNLNYAPFQTAVQLFIEKTKNYCNTFSLE